MNKQFLCLLGVMCTVYALDARGQTISQERRQEIIAKLSSPDAFVRNAGAYEVRKYKLAEAVPIIEQIYWHDSYTLNKMVFLDILEQFNSPMLREFARGTIDSAEILLQGKAGQPYDALELRALASCHLIALGDYSTAQYVFEDIQRKLPNVDGPVLWALRRLADSPGNQDRAKSVLRTNARKNTSQFQRYLSMSYLVEKFGADVSDDLVEMARFDTTDDSSNRTAALRWLFHLNYPALDALLKERLLKEPFDILRLEIADSLLNHFGTPADYKFVQDYVAGMIDLNEKSEITDMMQSFRPPAPLASLLVATLLDILVSDKHEVASLGWLGDANFVKELDNSLENAKKHLAKGDSVKCYIEIQKFQDKVNKEYEKTIDNEKKGKSRDKKFVTVEGWKFLYYNAQYIMDRLPSTVSILLDDLRSQLSQLLTKGLIGDARFVKGLDNGLENATKRLSKSDSVNCYKEVATFQDEVNKEYLKTVDDDKKGKGRDKRFVTAEGWQVLYYGAQEIMARLPSGKKK